MTTQQRRHHYVLRHMRQGFLASADHQVFSDNIAKAQPFDTAEVAVAVAVKLWGDHALAIDFKIIPVYEEAACA